MARAKQMHDWDQTSLLWAAIANTVRDPKMQSKPFSPGIVHPFREEEEYNPKPIKADISVLKMLLPKSPQTRDSKRDVSGSN